MADRGEQRCAAPRLVFFRSHIEAARECHVIADAIDALGIEQQDRNAPYHVRVLPHLTQVAVDGAEGVEAAGLHRAGAIEDDANRDVLGHGSLRYQTATFTGESSDRGSSPRIALIPRWRTSCLPPRCPVRHHPPALARRGRRQEPTPG